MEELQRYFDDYMFLSKQIAAIRHELESRAMTEQRNAEYLKKLKEENYLEGLRSDMARKIRIRMDVLNTDS